MMFVLLYVVPEHEKMGKGVTLTHDEAEKLSALLKDNL